MTARLTDVAALVFALCLALGGFAAMPRAAAQTEHLELSVDRSEMLAAGGSATVTVRLTPPADSRPATVTLTTDLGAFGADSGPSRVVIRPTLNPDTELLEGSVALVGDGRAGLAVVTARAGVMVEAVTVTFIGAPAQIVVLRPSNAAPLDASRSHVVQIEVRDSRGQPVPGAPLRLESLAENGASLRSAGGESGALLALRTSERGRVSAVLSAEPGALLLRAVSVEAAVDTQLTFHGEPTRLRLWALNSTLERGVETASALVLARLVDAEGRAVPGRRVSLTVADDSGIRLITDGDPTALATDAGGDVLARATVSAAQSGEYWLRAYTEAGGGLGDVVEVTVVGAPQTIYVSAVRIDMLEGADDDVEEYILRAEVVDPSGRAVAPGYTIRWRVGIESGAATLTPETSPVQRGVAISRLRLENASSAPVLHAALIEAPQVAVDGLLADLAAPGLPLSPGVNVVRWVGPPIPISTAIAPLAHLDVTVWRARSDDADWQVYTTRDAAPGGEAYELARGDRLHIRVESAARLSGVER